MTRTTCRDSGIEFESKDGWVRTKVEPAPNGEEVLLSDGKKIYLGVYNADIECFIDDNRFVIPTPKYWHLLPLPPETKYEIYCK